jgi:hypothetical protein
MQVGEGEDDGEGERDVLGEGDLLYVAVADAVAEGDREGLHGNADTVHRTKVGHTADGE